MDGVIDMPTKVKYKNEFSALGNAPSAASYGGYFFTVDGDDNPYVNINITTGGVGDVRAKIATEYSSIDLLGDQKKNGLALIVIVAKETLRIH